MADKLTEKQKRFADEYLIDLNAIRAYMKVYKCKESTAKVNAYRTLDIASVKEYIASKQKKLEEKAELNARWVLDNLKLVYERCLQPEPLYDKEGNVVEYTFQAAGANKSLELIGKHLGMFTDKIEQKVEATNVNLNLNDSDEVQKYLAGLVAEIERRKKKIM